MILRVILQPWPDPASCESTGLQEYATSAARAFAGGRKRYLGRRTQVLFSRIFRPKNQWRYFMYICINSMFSDKSTSWDDSALLTIPASKIVWSRRWSMPAGARLLRDQHVYSLNRKRERLQLLSEYPLVLKHDLLETPHQVWFFQFFH